MNTQRLFLVALLLFAACGREPQTGDTSEPSTTTSSKLPHKGGRLVVAMAGEPTSLNPITAGRQHEVYTLSLLHRSLVRINASSQYDPALADRWGWSEDGLTLDLHLRPNLRWSDGTPFTAEQVVRSFQIYDHPDTPFRHKSLLEPLQNVLAEADDHVRFVFDAVTPMRLRHVALDPLPVHVIGDLEPADIQGWPIQREPVTLGPFRLASWQAGVGMTLERNPHYYGKPPYLDEIHLKFVASRTDQVMQLEAGDVDFVVDVPVHEVPRLKASGQVNVISVPGRLLNYLVFNLENPRFQDRRVRQAISHAIDRAALIDGVLEGHATAGGAFLPPVLWSHHEGLQADEHDPEKAALLLTQAGWVDSNDDGTRDKDGVEFEFRLFATANDPAREAAAELLRRDLEAIGITANTSLMEVGAQIGRGRKKDFDAMVLQLGSSLFTDPSHLVRSESINNFGGYSNPTIDELLDRALAEADREEAGRLWLQLQEVLHEDKPVVMLCYPHQIFGVRAHVRDATPNHVSPFHGIESWWVAP